MNGRFPPSPRRLREARARGEVAHSSLLSGAAALAAGGVAAAFVARPAVERVTLLLRRAVGGHARAAEILPTVNAIVLPVALAIFVAALAAGLVQTRGLFAWSALGHRADRDEEALPVIGWAAAAFLALAALATLRVVIASAARADALEPVAAVAVTGLRSLWPRALVVLALAGLGDFAWRRARLYDSLSMTRAERERERREEEGDPRLRAERRRRHRALTADKT